MREIVLDTETTGLDPAAGHRLVEVACIELVNRIPSGQTFQRYLNPERDVPAEAFAVHGLSAEFLKDKPLFAGIADDMLAFIGDAPLVAHNALVRPRLPQRRARTRGPAAARARADGRYAPAGAPPASGRAEQPRRSVRALRHRQFATAPSTARCSMPSFWPRSTWN